MRTASCALAFMAAFASPAVAQEPSIWTEQEAGASRQAFFADAQIVMVARCQDGDLDFLLRGVAGDEAFPQTQARFDDTPGREELWMRSEDGSELSSHYPARLIRGLAGADRVAFTFEDRSELSVNLPPDAEPLRAVLTACGRRLASPHDDAPFLPKPEGRNWERTPRPRWSSGAERDGVRGKVVLACLTGERGRLLDCEVARETPTGYGLGRSAVSAMDGARVRLDSEPGHLVIFTLNIGH